MDMGDKIATHTTFLVNRGKAMCLEGERRETKLEA